MNRWQAKWFSNLHAHSKLLFINIEDNLVNGFYDLSMKSLRVALKPLTDAEIRLAFKEIEPRLIISSDKKKVSIKGCNCVVEPIFKNDGDLFIKFINEFNIIRKGKYKAIAKYKTQFVARLKDGYTMNDIILALKNAMLNEFHVKNNFNSITPEFITRSNILETYLNYKPSGEKMPDKWDLKHYQSLVHENQIIYVTNLKNKIGGGLYMNPANGTPMWRLNEDKPIETDKKENLIFPDNWDDIFAFKLSVENMNKYFEHLKSLNLVPVKNRHGILLDWVKA